MFVTYLKQLKLEAANERFRRHSQEGATNHKFYDYLIVSVNISSPDRVAG